MNEIVVRIPTWEGESLKPFLLPGCPAANSCSSILCLSNTSSIQTVQEALCEIIFGEHSTTDACGPFAPLFKNNLIQKIVSFTTPLKLMSYEVSKIIAKMFTVVSQKENESKKPGETLLTCAIKQNALDDVRALMQIMRTDISYDEGKIDVPFLMAVRRGHLSILSESLKIAQSYKTPILRNILDRALVEAVNCKHAEIVDLLLTTEARRNKALMRAISTNQLDIVRKILGPSTYFEIERYAIDDKKNTALMLAVLTGNVNMVHLVLKSTTPKAFYMINNDGNSALALSVINNNLEIFTLLLKSTNLSRIDEKKISNLIYGDPNLFEFQEIWHAYKKGILH